MSEVLSPQQFEGGWWHRGEGPGTGAMADVYKHPDTGRYEVTNVKKGYDAPKGRGRELMDALHAEADKRGATLQVHVLPDKPRLHEWYRGMGYEVEDPKGGPFGGPRMVRRPR